ncbi:hypothetical protein B0H10DRAFT_1961104 [Mycena sp. CBHHK59/15]|nr:hypothetical protein B0H10DRAFT_1961104 [Mycena sp. CBHHK59/15]
MPTNLDYIQPNFNAINWPDIMVKNQEPDSRMRKIYGVALEQKTAVSLLHRMNPPRPPPAAYLSPFPKLSTPSALGSMKRPHYPRVRKAKAKGLSRGFEQGKKTPEEGRQNFWDGRASSRNDIQMHPIKPNSFRTHTMLPDMQRKILVKPGFGQSQVKPIPAAGLWLWLDPRWAKARGL